MAAALSYKLIDSCVNDHAVPECVIRHTATVISSQQHWQEQQPCLPMTTLCHDVFTCCLFSVFMHHTKGHLVHAFVHVRLSTVCKACSYLLVSVEAAWQYTLHNMRCHH